MKHSIIGTLLDVECRTCLFFEETQGLGSGFLQEERATRDQQRRMGGMAQGGQNERLRRLPAVNQGVLLTKNQEP